ncbi:MAG: DUF58 domain-containing protein [Halanaerobiaceae bacterium]
MVKFVVSLITIFVLVIGVVGIFTGNYTVFFACLLISLFLQGLNFWNERIFAGLTVSRSFTRRKVFCGQKVKLEVTVENRKLLPLAGLTVESNLSPHLKFINQEYISRGMGSGDKFKDTFFLKWYERIKRSYEIVPTHRGRQSIYFLRLEYTDPFGIFNNSLEEEGLCRLLVYPRLVPVAAAAPAFSMLFGSKPREGWIFQDRLNRVGVREYTPVDDIRGINWKVSARRGELYSDIYRPSLEKEVSIVHCLNESPGISGKVNSRDFELSLIVAASLADEYLRRGYSVEFFSSHRSGYGSREYTTVPAAGEKGREAVLTTMALLENRGRIRSEEMLVELSNEIETGGRMVVITGKNYPGLKHAFKAIEKRFEVLVISIDEAEERLQDVNQLFVQNKEDYNEIREIRLSS